MRMSFITSASFNRNPGKAKKQASEGPVVINDRGTAAYVLVSYAEFQANWKAPRTLVEALNDPRADEKEFEPERLSFETRTVEF